MAKIKLTKRAVEALQATLSDLVTLDTEIKGFGVKTTRRGKKTYFLYYRTQGGTERRPAIGTHGEITCEQAREIALDWKARIARGEDPSLSRKQHRQSPTVAELCERFMREHSDIRNKEGTTYNYQRLIDRFIIKSIGSRKVAEIGRDDISRLHASLSATPYQANRLLGLLSKLMNVAEKWEIRADGSNPCRHVEKFPESGRERYLSAKELKRLSEVLNDPKVMAKEMPQVGTAIKLLLTTGCRLSEILTLKWEYVDYNLGILRLPDSKTGKRIITLNPSAIAELGAIKRSSNPYVIVGKRKNSRLVNLQKPWRRIRTAAGLEDVRIHDLRHTFASVALGAGVKLDVISKLLGHATTQMTMRYAHLADDPRKDAADAVSSELSKHLQFAPAPIPEQEREPSAQLDAVKHQRAS